MEINNLFTQSFRSLRQQKGFAVLNFLGMATAIAVCLLAALLVFHERSFGNFHKVGTRWFRVVTQLENTHAETVRLPELATIVPSIIGAEMVDMGQFMEVNFHEKELIRLSPEHFFEEKDLIFTDTAFFSLFHFETKTGNARTALARPNVVLLTETTAAKYFPHENAVGKRLVIEVDDCPVKEFEVAGIVADAPVNSHLPFKLLGSAASLKPNPDADWGWFFGGQYLYGKPGGHINPAQIGEGLRAMANEHKYKYNTETSECGADGRGGGHTSSILSSVVGAGLVPRSSTSRGLAPSPGPITPRSSSISTRRAARA